jgi:hypothetical protein
VEYKVEILEEASKFILKLEPKMQAKVQYSIKLLEEFGYLLTEPHSKKVTGKKELYELRVKVGTDNAQATLRTHISALLQYHA